ncbi:MAG: YdcH family protein [Shewanella sp.]|nr:YdcH family protein [Shewanella sp.]MCF1430838.1 YdcH family protein [Shewanella sp.]MCF1437241.1 YdcH family protein [Shewanella sp.]MCF1456114.1 YdcH family protein [Shewanella sp.]
MFPEYRGLITDLKNKDHHFQNLFDKHNELDEKIAELEKHPAEFSGELHSMKQERLALKDELFKILQKYNK